MIIMAILIIAHSRHNTNSNNNDVSNSQMSLGPYHSSWTSSGADRVEAYMRDLGVSQN